MKQLYLYLFFPAFLLFNVFFGITSTVWAQQPSIDLKLQPLSQEIFAQTEQFLQQYKQQGKQARTILESVEFNQESEIKIAEEADVFTMLVRTGPSSAILKYYTLNGELKWERPIDFSPQQPYRISHQLSNTGHRVLVKFEGYFKTLLDENGNEAGTIDDYIMLEMAPSGNFYYPLGEGIYVHSRFRIYDANLQLITEDELGFWDTSDKKEYEYRYAYRIIKDDKLLLQLSRSKKDSLILKKLYIYDLKNRNLLFSKDLIIENSQIYNFNLGDSKFDIKNDKVVMAGFLGREVVLLDIDLPQKQGKVHRNFSVFGVIGLSKDAKELFVYSFGKTTKEIKVYNLFSQEVQQWIPIENQISGIMNFKLAGDSLQILSIIYPAKIQQISTFSLTQKKQIGKMVGWFDKNLKVGLLPGHVPSSTKKIKLIKLEPLNR